MEDNDRAGEKSGSLINVVEIALTTKPKIPQLRTAAILLLNWLENEAKRLHENSTGAPLPVDSVGAPNSRDTVPISSEPSPN